MKTVVDNAWIIAALPLFSWLIITFFNRRLGERAHWVGVPAILASLVLAIISFSQAAAGYNYHFSAPWLKIGRFTIEMGYQVDNLTAVMLIVVTVVSSMVQIFSIGYMHGDRRYARYYGTLSLFTFAMLALVLADNFLLLLISWEIMGLCSYLLIGHWFEEEWPRMASIKAFLTTRVGDVAMMAGIWFLFARTGTFSFEKIAEMVEHGELAPLAVTIGALAVFGGAVGKSAQFPLHVWLPDAMAGPTPVSALIHAATMVAAGVYLVSRAYGIFAFSPTALTVVAVIGGITALMAATIGTVMTDLKKVMAYSTISQLGYMMLALGVGGYTAGVFHLTTHAFFKALLFLTAGSVSHAVHTFEMHSMGGLARKMPITYATFLIGAASLAGIPPFSGFWSKDEILLDAFHANKVLFWMGVLTAMVTAYYVTRATYLVFLGQPRDHHKYHHAHESSAVMTVPLIILAVLAAVAGLPGSPLMGKWFGHFITFGHGHEAEPVPMVMFLAIGASVIGVVAGWAVYGARIISREKVIHSLRPLYTLLKNKYYFDEIYHAAFVWTGHRLAELVAWFDLRVIDWIVNALGYGTVRLSQATGEFDLLVVDGLVNGVAGTVVATGRQARRLQTGYVQGYVLTIFATVVAGLIIFQVIGG